MKLIQLAAIAVLFPLLFSCVTPEKAAEQAEAQLAAKCTATGRTYQAVSKSGMQTSPAFLIPTPFFIVGSTGGATGYASGYCIGPNPTWETACMEHGQMPVPMSTTNECAAVDEMMRESILAFMARAHAQCDPANSDVGTVNTQDHRIETRCVPRMSAALPPLSMPLTTVAPQWRTFNDPEGLFSFETPDEVHVTHQTGTRPDGTATQTTLFAYGSTKPGALGCAVSETEFGGPVVLAESVLETVALTFKSQLQAQHVQPDVDTAIVTGNRNGRRFEFKDLKGNGVSIRWFVVKNRLFQLICTTPADSSMAALSEIERVISSFRFLAS